MEYNISDNAPTVVIDNGSRTIKAGFSGDDAPRSTFPTVVGLFRAVAMMPHMKETYVGDEAIQKRGILRLRHPVVGGVVANFTHMKMIWEHVFVEELMALPEAQPLLLTDTYSSHNRGSMAQKAFESLNVPALNISNQDILSCYAMGRTSGIVINSGESVTRVVPVYNGIPLPVSEDLDVGGEHITAHLAQLLMTDRDIAITTRQEYEFIRNVMEKSGFVALNFQEELDLASRSLSKPEETYTLPDGTPVTIGSERFRSPELLFQPNSTGSLLPGVHKLTHTVISQLGPHMQSEMYGNVIIAGGNTMFPGFVDRLKAELVSLAPPNTRVRMIAPADRHIAPWIGGSILSSLSIFKHMLVTKQEYEEIGIEAINRKFL